MFRNIFTQLCVQDSNSCLLSIANSHCLIHRVTLFGNNYLKVLLWEGNWTTLPAISATLISSSLLHIVSVLLLYIIFVQMYPLVRMYMSVHACSFITCCKRVTGLHEILLYPHVICV